MKPRLRSIAGSIDLAGDRARCPGDQAKLALVFLAVFPRRPQRLQERIRVRPRAGVDLAGSSPAGSASISTDSPGLIVPSERCPALARTCRFDQTASLSSNSLSFTTRRLPSVSASRMAPPKVSISSARNIARLRGWTVKFDERRHRRRLPPRSGDLLAADRSTVVERQGERRRVARDTRS